MVLRIPSSSYKANTASVETIVVDEETGEEKKRLINRMRWKGLGPISVAYTEKTVGSKVIHAPQNLFNAYSRAGAGQTIGGCPRAPYPS